MQLPFILLVLSCSLVTLGSIGVAVNVLLFHRIDAAFVCRHRVLPCLAFGISLLSSIAMAICYRFAHGRPWEDCVLVPAATWDAGLLVSDPCSI
jgi:hypothetical protein